MKRQAKDTLVEIIKVQAHNIFYIVGGTALGTVLVDESRAHWLKYSGLFLLGYYGSMLVLILWSTGVSTVERRRAR